MTEQEFSDIYQELVDNYYGGVEKQDAKLLTAFVKDDRVLNFKTDDYRQQYVTLRIYRAECYTLFGMFAEAIKEYRLALAFQDKSKQWNIYLSWCKLHYLQFIHSEGEDVLQAIANAAIIVAEKGRNTISLTKKTEYQHLAFGNIEAFFQLYLGERDKAKAIYQSFKFTPIPITQYNDENELDYLFANYAKGLSVAIELQDEKLLRNLLKVISIDDQTLYGEKNLFKLFHNTLLTTMDTHPQFSNEFNQLFQINNKVQKEMKELSFFLTSIQSNMLSALDTFFNVFK